MIAPAQALALRRLLLTAAALTATLVAHAICAGGLDLVPAAPLVWGSACCLAVVAGPRRGAAWSDWSPPGLVARLVAIQLVLHAALTGAPWAFGVSVHHPPPLVTPSILVAHGAAAAVLAIVLLGAQRALSAAQRVVGAVRRGLLRLSQAAGAPARLAAPRLERRAPASISRRAFGARGPPVTSS